MRLSRIAALALVAVALTGCAGGGSGGDDNGVADKSADEIVAASRDAAKSASSVHVSGTVGTGAQAVTLDLQLAAGKGAAGRVEIGGKGADIVVIDDKAYLKADAEFWKQFGGSSGAAVAQLINGRWLVAPTSAAAFSQFTSFTDTQELFDGILSGTGSGLEKGDETTVDGTSAIALTDPSKDGTLYVATEGEPYPLKIESSSGSGSISFTDWNETVELEAPEGAVDVSQFPGLSG